MEIRKFFQKCLFIERSTLYQKFNQSRRIIFKPILFDFKFYRFLPCFKWYTEQLKTNNHKIRFMFPQTILSSYSFLVMHVSFFSIMMHLPMYQTMQVGSMMNIKDTLQLKPYNMLHGCVLVVDTYLIMFSHLSLRKKESDLSILLTNTKQILPKIE